MRCDAKERDSKQDSQGEAVKIGSHISIFRIELTQFNRTGLACQD
jgi:hypothetical protein